MTAIPDSPTSITAEWLSAALHEAGRLERAAVVGLEAEAIGEGAGFVGSLVRLRPVYDRAEPGAPESLVVKLASADPMVRGVARSLELYKREILFYRSLASGAPVNPPRHFFSAADDVYEHFVLALEDLAPARFVPQTAGAAAGEAADIVTALARLHARYWNDGDGDDSAILPRFDDAAEALEALIAFTRPNFEARFAGLLPGPIARDLDLGLDTYPRVLEALREGPVTLVHGDVRLDNIAFDDAIAVRGPERIRLLDWQVASRFHPAYDLAYFLFGSLDPERRRDMEPALVACYHETLLGQGIDYARDRLEADLRIASCLMWGVLVVILGGILDDNPRDRPLIRAFIERFSAGMLDHGACEEVRRF